MVARPNPGGLRECQVLKESQGYAGKIHMSLDRFHGTTDFAKVGLAELRDIQFLVALQFREDLGPETVAEPTQEALEKQKHALDF
jgi:hypothetical protein